MRLVGAMLQDGMQFLELLESLSMELMQAKLAHPSSECLPGSTCYFRAARFYVAAGCTRIGCGHTFAHAAAKALGAPQGQIKLWLAVKCSRLAKTSANGAGHCEELQAKHIDVSAGLLHASAGKCFLLELLGTFVILAGSTSSFGLFRTLPTRILFPS